MLDAKAGRALTDQDHGTSRTRLLLAGAGGVLLWAILLLASEVLWQRAFGFSTSEAWALAVGLFGYIGLLALAMLVLVLAVARER